MKDKRAEQAKKRAEHKKRRRKAPNLSRQKANKIEKEKLLIICEGKNTEPSYFNQFRLTSATIKAVGEGYNTKSLIERAKQIADKDEYDQVWCVFDKDDFSNEDFNAAIDLAEKYQYKLAYSNQAFEYWIILHFEDHQGGAMPRKLYYKKINDYLKTLGLSYDKKRKIITKEIFDTFLEIDPKCGETRQERAKKRAKKIYDKIDHSNPAKAESCTCIFKLVEEIEKYL